jgi:hypothetical protein
MISGSLLCSGHCSGLVFGVKGEYVPVTATVRQANGPGGRKLKRHVFASSKMAHRFLSEPSFVGKGASESKTDRIIDRILPPHKREGGRKLVLLLICP